MLDIKNGKCFSLRTLFDVYSYPNDQNGINTFYDQSTVVSEFLIRDKGVKVFVEFIKNICADNSKNYIFKTSAICEENLQATYGYKDIEQLEDNIRCWLINGNPRILNNDSDYKNTIPNEYLNK